MTNDLFSSRNKSPITMMNSLAKQAKKDLDRLQSENDSKGKVFYQNIASLMQQMWSLEQILDSLELDDYSSKAIKIYSQNMQKLFEKMNFVCVQASKGEPVTEEIVMSFEPITVLPNPSGDEIVVDKVISPAIFHDHQLLLKGTMQILKPGSQLDNSQEKEFESIR